MVKNLPALGFNTWNTFGENINEQLVRDTADAMAATGLRDAGYTYLVIDDCWAEKERDDSHRLGAEVRHVFLRRQPDLRGLSLQLRV